MNHKLHNTIMASAIVGTALLFALLAAEPLGHDRASGRQAHRSGPAAGALMAGDLRQELANDIESRIRALEVELALPGAAGEALALASALLATSIVEATVASALEDTGSRQPPAPRASGLRDQAQGDAPARSRGALTMPYFSTAQGLRRGHRG